MLHGCAQTSFIFAQSTRMNSLADQRGFVVLYPEQDVASNSSRCWNWFTPDNFVRGGGEIGMITGMVNEVRSKILIDSTKIGVVGFSAGGAMASNLIACYSDIFSMAVINSGLEYKAATSVNDAYLAMSQSPSHDLGPTALDAARCTGPGAKMSKLLVVQGTADVVVNPKNSGRIVNQFTLVNDLLDDGQANGSQNLNVISSEAGQIIGGHPFKVVTYGGNGHVQIRQVLVDGMPHAYSGGTLGIPFNDPTGPSTSKMAVDLLYSN
jgi:poly(hydroxyalkanoate) depolymerase family esterase